MKTRPLSFRQAECLLRKTFDEVKSQHGPEGHSYIRTHWQRYVHLVWRLPAVDESSTVLEIGASILSNLMRRRFGAKVHTVHHELEQEWPERFTPDGIHPHACELTMQPLPVPDGAFDVILFDEVMEHLPVLPNFLFEQIVRKLKPEGQLLFSVPNFATSEKRLQLLLGRNPQDPMDPRFVYYAHHREPVMSECLELVRACDGTVLEHEWSDFDIAPSVGAAVLHCLRHLRHGKLHRVIHQLIPSTRAYLFIRVGRDPGHESRARGCIPPLSDTLEFRGKGDRGRPRAV